MVWTKLPVKETTVINENEDKWYALHTYSGYEYKVADDLVAVVNSRGLQHVIKEVLVPTEEQLVDREHKTTDKYTGISKIEIVKKPARVKLFPGYVYVRMIMTKESWFVCRNVPGVTGFVSPDSQHPQPLSDKDVAALKIAKLPDEPIENKVQKLKVGMRIKLKEGVEMFALEAEDYEVVAIDEEDGKITVLSFALGKNGTETTIDISDVDL